MACNVAKHEDVINSNSVKSGGRDGETGEEFEVLEVAMRKYCFLVILL